MREWWFFAFFALVAIGVAFNAIRESREMGKIKPVPCWCCKVPWMPPLLPVPFSTYMSGCGCSRGGLCPDCLHCRLHCACAIRLQALERAIPQ